MVNGALTFGSIVGLVLSAGFVYWQVGRYAAPQVPRSRFDERKVVIGYTAGLFLGIPVAVLFLFFDTAMANGALGAVAFYLALVLGVSEVAQWAVLRTSYFGSDGSGPFYVLGVRAGMGGLLALVVVTSYLEGASLTAAGLAGVLLAAVALVALEVACGVLSLAPRWRPGRTGGGPLSGVLFGAVGFFLIGLGSPPGNLLAFAGALIVAGGGAGVYQRLAPPILDRIRPPGEPGTSESGSEATTFGRTDR